jgi:uncharacterized protein YxeA
MKKNILSIIIIVLLIGNLAFSAWLKCSMDTANAALATQQKEFQTEIKGTLAVQDAMLDRLMHPGR